MREAGITADLVGGTSIGSIIAAGVAAGWDDEQMVERLRRPFLQSNPLSDFTLPLVSLVSGRKVKRLLREEFGTLTDAVVEDFEGPTDAGWTHLEFATQDDWHRGVPAGKAGDPSSASSGTGRADTTSSIRPKFCASSGDMKRSRSIASSIDAIDCPV